MRMTKNKKYAATGAGLASLVGMVAVTMPTTATAAGDEPSARSAITRANLQPLNNSGVNGVSTVTVEGQRLDVSVDADRLLRDMPHAQHIHFGAKARHECPTVRDDDNADGRLNTLEGQPAYGRVRVSLTTRGDTSPDSTLAVDRFPTAGNGEIDYQRAIRTSDRVARGIANGNAVVVIHGIDYNGNRKYDFRAAGKSELDPNLPTEATDTVSCGVLREVQQDGGDGGDGGGIPTP